MTTSIDKQTQEALRVERALKLALEALELNCSSQTESPATKAMAAIREALAEQPAQQEPVALARMRRFREISHWNRAQAEPPITVTKELWVAEQLEQFYTSPPNVPTARANANAGQSRSDVKPWVGLEPKDFGSVIRSDAFEAGAYWANNILREKNEHREKNA